MQPVLVKISLIRFSSLWRGKYPEDTNFSWQEKERAWKNLWKRIREYLKHYLCLTKQLTCDSDNAIGDWCSNINVFFSSETNPKTIIAPNVCISQKPHMVPHRLAISEQTSPKKWSVENFIFFFVKKISAARVPGIEPLKISILKKGKPFLLITILEKQKI